MLYEVSTPSGYTAIIDAGSSREAKIKVCKQMRIKTSDPWAGASAMQACKINVDYPEVVYRPLRDEEILSQFEGKDVVIYDEHHGIATRIRKATAVSIGYYVDSYSTIIVL